MIVLEYLTIVDDDMKSQLNSAVYTHTRNDKQTG